MSLQLISIAQEKLWGRGGGREEGGGRGRREGGRSERERGKGEREREVKERRGRVGRGRETARVKWQTKY